MTISAITAGFFFDVAADHYKTAASEGWGNLLDHPAPAGQAAAYQYNQTDLECAVRKADAIGARWEGPDLDAARMAALFNLGAKS